MLNTASTALISSAFLRLSKIHCAELAGAQGRACRARAAASASRMFGGRPGQRHPHHAEPGVVELAEIHRHWLCVAEQERRMREQQHRRQDHGAERVDVAERIEADTAELRGRIVTETMCHEGVRSLVEGDGEHQRQHPHREVIQRNVHGSSVPVYLRSCSRPSQPVVQQRFTST
ncbi:hypothetical protein ACVWZW_002495 [Bradyrhizobium sp. F1.13.4]